MRLPCGVIISPAPTVKPSRPPAAMPFMVDKRMLLFPPLSNAAHCLYRQEYSAPMHNAQRAHRYIPRCGICALCRYNRESSQRIESPASIRSLRNLSRARTIVLSYHGQMYWAVLRKTAHICSLFESDKTIAESSNIIGKKPAFCPVCRMTR